MNLIQETFARLGRQDHPAVARKSGFLVICKHRNQQGVRTSRCGYRNRVDVVKHTHEINGFRCPLCLGGDLIIDTDAYRSGDA